jgi:putative redox protein
MCRTGARFAQRNRANVRVLTHFGRNDATPNLGRCAKYMKSRALFGSLPAFHKIEAKLMQVTADFLGDVRFDVQARGHRIVCDQPVDSGGSDAGMTPPEFLLASLATCAGYYAAQYLKARQLPAKDLSVRVSAEKAEKPVRLASFRIEVTAPGLDERHQAGILRAAKACLIHNTLLGQPSIEVMVNAEATLTA